MRGGGGGGTACSDGYKGVQAVCSARLSRAQVLTFTSSSVRDRTKRGGGGGGGTTCIGGYKGVQAV